MDNNEWRRQNYVGNPVLGDTSYNFRPVPPPRTKLAPGIPDTWGGGDFGTEGVLNPTQPVDIYGDTKCYPYGPTFKEPYLLHIDSSDRDAVSYPLAASFRVDLGKALRGVYSIEVLDISFPNQDGGVVPPGRYVYLIAGRVIQDPLGNRPDQIKPMNIDLGIYNAAHPTNLTPGTISNTVCEFALAKVWYDTERVGNQYFRRTDYRYIKYLQPVQDRMNYIDVSLVDKDGNLYDLDPNDPNWNCTLEIVCKQ